MKTLLKLVLVVGAVVAAVPVVSYRTVRPCGMLEKELVRRSERALAAARDSVREATAILGNEARDAADAVASSVEHLASSLAAGAAAAKVERMSARECAGELVRLKIKGE
jgi:hypothetical protein